MKVKSYFTWSWIGSSLAQLKTSLDFDGCFAYNGFNKEREYMAMTAQQFRSEMILKIRQFDSWSYKDQLASPADYKDYEFSDWFDLFTNYMENEND